MVAIGGLVALAAWQLWPAAGPGRLPQNLDLMLQYVPNAAYVQRSLAGARLPLWNPYLGAGMPFAADPGAGVWYLPNWAPLLALPLEGAVRVILWGHLLWAALGMYLYLRAALGAAPAAAWIGAAAFSLTTWLPGLAGMPVVLTAVSWLPWLLLLGDRATQGEAGGEPARRPAARLTALALAGALQALAGWPAGAYLSWLVLGLLVFRRRWERRTTVGLLYLGVAAGTAALLAGVLLVPAAEFVWETNYAETRPLGRVDAEGYLTLLSWLRPAGGSGSLESSQLYLGMTPLILALVGLTSLRRRNVAIFALLALLALLLAAGTHGPLFAPLYRWLPGFRIVYLPARLGIVAAFALATLAALGAQRLLAEAWSPRQAAGVAALAGAAGLLVLGQFWHSEGYDDFRRLLTNVGRLAGGPFLTREQELHYLLFGLLALGVVVGAALPLRASLAPRGWLAGALLSLTAFDLGLAQRQASPPAFDPVSWYAPARDAAGVLYGARSGVDVPLPEQRLAGMQWHGTAHFLSDFPRTANPALLPPNLALLAGVRDAQAYNPLLLRRAVDYFARLNHGRTDDHWLWIEDFRSPLVDALGVQLILSGAPYRWQSRESTSGGVPPDRWRLAQPLLPAGVALTTDGAETLLWRAGPESPPQPWRLYVVSYLGEATALPQGAPAIELQLDGTGYTAGPGETAGATSRTATLRAGVETAEWAYERPDVRGKVRHQQAPVAQETRLSGAVSGTYTVFEYLATVDLEAFRELREVRARALVPGVPGYIQGLYLEPVSDGRFTSGVHTSGVPGTFNNKARPRASLAGAGPTWGITWLDDRPERVALRVQAPRPGTLVLADSYYPGWTATVDNVPVPVSVVDGLFRGVPVGAGSHDVVFVYRPVSLRIGAGLTFAGLLATGAAGATAAASQALARAPAPKTSSAPTRKGPKGPGA